MAQRRRERPAIPAWLRRYHTGAGPTEDRPRPRPPRTIAARASVVALHLVPGVLAYGLLRTAREPLQRLLGLSSAAAQIGVIMNAVMLSMGVATFVLPKRLDGLGPRDALRLTGARGVDLVALGLAVVIWGFVIVVSSLSDHEENLRSLVERVDWLALPSWHFQRNDGFRMLSPVVAGLALVANLVCEELWFRGYLQDKLRLLRGSSWIVAGLLFTLYHLFEAPIAYPGVLGGLALAGLWALRRNLWSCILLHALLQAPV